jgi:hypothetical protein
VTHSELKIEFTYRLERRETRWWGRRRWDCEKTETDTGIKEWLGWDYRHSYDAEDQVRDLRLWEIRTAAVLRYLETTSADEERLIRELENRAQRGRDPDVGEVERIFEEREKGERT